MSRFSGHQCRGATKEFLRNRSEETAQRNVEVTERIQAIAANMRQQQATKRQREIERAIEESRRRFYG